MDLERRLFPLVYIFAAACNVLITKWTYTIPAQCEDGKLRLFWHPILLTYLTFVGQALCYIIFKLIITFLRHRAPGTENWNFFTRGNREWSPLAFLLPALLETVASVLMFSGLYLTYASSFQMIRGAALIFMGILSSISLNQRLIARHWMAMFTIACGIVVVLSIDVQRIVYDKTTIPHADENSILTGDLLVLCAQVFHAAQFFYVEKHLKGADVPPLHAAGWIGIFGMIITAFLGICMNFMPTQTPFNDNTRGVFDDFEDVWVQLKSESLFSLALGILILSSAIYNYTSLSIVKFSSTVNRIIADGLCVTVIWWMALVLEWEILNIVSLMGFVILQMGVVAYRNAVFLQWYRTLMSRLSRNRYSDMNSASDTEVPNNRPADVI